MAWVADRAGTRLVAQIDAIAPNRRKDSDGTIGDPAHAARDSAHNPEDTADAEAPGNPDDQVDAFDVTHDPAHGCDIGAIWENIRASRDRRAKFAIFNRRCFSNYNHPEGPAYTWRPYRGSNPHDKHGHIEIDDRHHDQTHDWKIGDTMTPAEVQAACLKAIHQAVDIAANRSDPTGRQIGDDLAALLAPLSGKLDAIAAAITDLEQDGMTQAELDAFADAVAARLTPLQAQQLANALTLRFTAGTA